MVTDQTEFEAEMAGYVWSDQVEHLRSISGSLQRWNSIKLETLIQDATARLSNVLSRRSQWDAGYVRHSLCARNTGGEMWYIYPSAMTQSGEDLLLPVAGDAEDKVITIAPTERFRLVSLFEPPANHEIIDVPLASLRAVEMFVHPLSVDETSQSRFTSRDLRDSILERWTAQIAEIRERLAPTRDPDGPSQVATIALAGQDIEWKPTQSAGRIFDTQLQTGVGYSQDDGGCMLIIPLWSVLERGSAVSGTPRVLSAANLQYASEAFGQSIQDSNTRSKAKAAQAVASLLGERLVDADLDFMSIGPSPATVPAMTFVNREATNSAVRNNSGTHTIGITLPLPAVPYRWLLPTSLQLTCVEDIVSASDSLEHQCKTAWAISEWESHKREASPALRSRLRLHAVRPLGATMDLSSTQAWATLSKSLEALNRDPASLIIRVGSQCMFGSSTRDGYHVYCGWKISDALTDEELGSSFEHLEGNPAVSFQGRAPTGADG